MISQGIYRFVIKRTYLNLLISLEIDPKKIKDLAKSTGMNYIHLTNVIQALKQEGIIKKSMNNHSFDISLTRKGHALCKALIEVKKIIESWNEKEEIKPKDEVIEDNDDPIIKEAVQDNYKEEDKNAE